MKKILVALFILVSCSAFAQHTTPRFGTAPNQDNTYRAMTFKKAAIADTAGSTVDTIAIVPNAFTNHYVLTLTDSCVLSIRNISSSYFGDEMWVTIENTSGSGHFVNFLGYSGLSSGTSKWGMTSTGTKISPATAKSATVHLICDGILWNEVSRAIR